MHIEVRRPFSLLLILVVVFFGLSILTASPADLLNGEGGQEPMQLAIHSAEDEMKRARLASQIAERHIHILQYQLRRLEAERVLMQGSLTEEQDEQFRQALRELLDLIEGKRRADDRMVQYFNQIWDARRSALASSALSTDDPMINIQWPMLPEYGISAIFHDAEYEEYFGMQHNAIDIPALQGTPVGAASTGIVEEVVDNGLGFSFMTIRHEGYVTLYGHLSEFSVSTGDRVHAGQEIGLSGGMPGTKGAGISTGPHLHFEVITGAGHRNPLEYLPAAGVQLRRS